MTAPVQTSSRDTAKPLIIKNNYTRELVKVLMENLYKETKKINEINDLQR